MGKDPDAQQAYAIRQCASLGLAFGLHDAYFTLSCFYRINCDVTLDNADELNVVGITEYECLGALKEH